MAGPPLIEIREWGRPARRLVLSRPIVVGRDCTGAMLADERVSRQHLRLVPSPTALSVVDLGSRNGTTVNGVALTRRVALVPGDVVRLGRSEIIVLHTPTVDPAVLEMEHDATRLAHVVGRRPASATRAGARSPLLALAERVLGIDARRRATAVPELHRADHQGATARMAGAARRQYRRAARVDRRDVPATCGRVVRLLPGDRAAAADPFSRRTGTVAQHLSTRRVKSAAAGTGHQPRPHRTQLAAQPRIPDRGDAVCRDRRQPGLPGWTAAAPPRGSCSGRCLRPRSPVASCSRARAVGAAPSVRCCRCNVSTGRRRSLPCPTPIARPASAVPRTVTTSSHEPPTTPTSPSPIPAGAGRASCSWRRCPDSCSASSCSRARRMSLRHRSFRCWELFVLVSIGSFYAVEAMSPLSPAMLTVTYAAARTEHLLLVHRPDRGRRAEGDHRS